LKKFEEHCDNASYDLIDRVILKRLNQPYFVAYVMAGILLGPYCIKVFSNADTIAIIGALGLLMQMFFIGTKMEIQTLSQNQCNG